MRKIDPLGLLDMEDFECYVRQMSGSGENCDGKRTTKELNAAVDTYCKASECLLKCTSKEFAGVDIDLLLSGAHGEAAREAAEDIAIQFATNFGKKMFRKGAGAVATLYDANNALECALECD
ncbi:hypothetical protein [Pseudomarimonas arenosa]|uniref:hypothetical protein n=1 Tax=Pseudomarimonas arenosa TaxID=2774145 RepID=UPI001E30A47B